MIMAVVVEEKRLGAWGPKKLGEFFSSIKFDWDIGERIIIKQGYLMNFLRGKNSFYRFRVDKESVRGFGETQ